LPHASDLAGNGNASGSPRADVVLSGAVHHLDLTLEVSVELASATDSAALWTRRCAFLRPTNERAAASFAHMVVMAVKALLEQRASVAPPERVLRAAG
jgi:hypothetical protein